MKDQGSRWAGLIDHNDKPKKKRNTMPAGTIVLSVFGLVLIGLGFLAMLTE